MTATMKRRPEREAAVAPPAAPPAEVVEGEIVTGQEQVEPFNYGVLGAESRIVVQQKTGEIHERLNVMQRSVIEIGQRLRDIKAHLGHGHWGKWLASEFRWSDQTAASYMNAAEMSDQNPKILEFEDRFAKSAMTALAAPSTTQAARDEAVERAAAGERITHQVAQDIKSRHAPPPAAGSSRSAPPAPPASPAPVISPVPAAGDDEIAAASTPAAPTAAARPPAPAAPPATPLAPARPAAPPPGPAPAPALPPALAIPAAPAQPATPAGPTREALVAAMVAVAFLDELAAWGRRELEKITTEANTAGVPIPLVEVSTGGVRFAVQQFVAHPALKTQLGFLAAGVRVQDPPTHLPPLPDRIATLEAAGASADPALVQAVRRDLDDQAVILDDATYEGLASRLSAIEQAIREATV